MEICDGPVRRVTRWQHFTQDERLLHYEGYRAHLECGHVLDIREEELADLRLRQSSGIDSLPCPICLNAEREEILVDLLGAD